jgi:hypothetical protein
MTNEMASKAAPRAERVCSTCKARKKACDKQLPFCGYCSKRCLVCRYVEDSLDISANASKSASLAGILIPISESTTLGDTLSLHVWRALKSSGLSLFELTDRFFRSFHTWLPIISPRPFLETVLATRDGALPAEFSILVLAMYLIVQRNYPAQNQVKPKEMWVSVKVLFAEAQAVLLPSITLVQTSILIAAYEHATGRSEAAYISIGTSIRMAQTLGIAKIDITQDTFPQDDYSVLSILEKRNLWWAVVILER